MWMTCPLHLKDMFIFCMWKYINFLFVYWTSPTCYIEDGACSIIHVPIYSVIRAHFMYCSDAIWLTGSRMLFQCHSCRDFAMQVDNVLQSSPHTLCLSWIDHIAKCHGCVIQLPGESYRMTYNLLHIIYCQRGKSRIKRQVYSSSDLLESFISRGGC